MSKKKKKRNGAKDSSIITKLSCTILFRQEQYKFANVLLNRVAYGSKCIEFIACTVDMPDRRFIAPPPFTTMIIIQDRAVAQRACG